MKKTVIRMNILVCSIVFFFLGSVSLSAQYVGGPEAITILKGEVATLQAQLPGASTQQLLNLHFQINYYKFIVLDIQGGSEVGSAIYENRPAGKFKALGGMGLATADNSAAAKQEVDALVIYVDDLLSD